MKDTARKKDGRQESPNIGQLALAAMFDARTTLYETVIHAGMSVLAGMLEDDRTVALPTWKHFADADPLTPRAVEQMVLGVSTRNYGRSIESAPLRWRRAGPARAPSVAASSPPRARSSPR